MGSGLSPAAVSGVEAALDLAVNTLEGWGARAA
jgi:hypothetical protein